MIKEVIENKYYCDICEFEIKEDIKTYKKETQIYHLCNDCEKKLMKSLINFMSKENWDKVISAVKVNEKIDIETFR